MVFQIVIKKNVTMKTRDIKIKDQELLNNPLYNTFVVNPITHKKPEMTLQMLVLLKRMTVLNIFRITTMTDTEITTDTAATVEIFHKINIDLTLDKNIIIDLEAHIDLDLTIIVNENSIQISI